MRLHCQQNESADRAEELKNKAGPGGIGILRGSGENRVEPHMTYEEVKQLALSIEQSKIMLEASKRNPVGWKA
ncbi:hypothetical protein GCK32_004187, partial [Trichostrongylus colubriformis]